MKLARLGDGPEIFHTLQGEGPSAGLPAVFIRASRCNLHCVWCDTDHTWNFEGTLWPHEKDDTPGYAKHRKSEATIELTPAAAADLILSYHCPRVVITGGEPLLQENDFLEMITHIRAQQPDCVFEVETNGTRTPSPAFAQAVDQFNVSPKLSNSGVKPSLRLVPDTLRFFASSPKAWFKFVIAAKADLDEVLALQNEFSIPASRILLMPEGRSAAELDTTAANIAELCRRHGFRFCDRLHIRLWGDKRGV
ncbi:MAG: 7-carboxy-7-deazaguanine synthase QueE [Verrucomicrobiia bacterium Tous-C5FEB]|nr:MAG: 7-carboxy-7-deazaguanine synthase QueE [Verrucomicrobiae bacterium Tous-C5FEB]